MSGLGWGLIVSQFRSLRTCPAGCGGVRACALGFGNGCIGDLHGAGGDGIDFPCQLVRECVRHHVVCAADVTDVICELCQVAEVSALPGCPWLHQWRWSAACGRGVEGELPSLQHEPEVSNP